MKQQLLFLLCIGVIGTGTLDAQELKLKKGIITDSLKINDSIPESFAVYLPTTFDNKGRWPVIFLLDLKGNSKRALRLFSTAAENQNYILAASNNLSDSLSISQNIIIANRMFNAVSGLFPLHNDRFYTAGFREGGKVAALAPTFVKQIDGVISISASVPNTEILTSKNSFHFIGIVGKEDFNYSEMLDGEKVLNRLKYPNNLLIFEGDKRWPDPSYLEKAMQILTLSAMAKGNAAKDEAMVKTSLEQHLKEVDELVLQRKWIDAYELLVETIGIYRPHQNVDSLVARRKLMKKDKNYRAQRRSLNAVLFKESFIKDEYDFNLTEDITTLNYNNLGWWNYQMGELREYEHKPKQEEREMGKRLIGYLNALIEDNIDIELAQSVVNEEAVIFLWMLKTITDPQNPTYYLKIISDSAKHEDFGTALFYLEELLKTGYKDKAALYDLENTALLRITPEFNKVVDKYLKEARYDIIEQ
ncbi:MAG: alpha/beta hydrolase [Flavobacteriaceae bacterium]